MKKEITIGYIRAFFDSEGVFSISKLPTLNKKLEATLKVSNTNKELLNLISKKLKELEIKNKIYKETRYKNHQQCYSIKIRDVLNQYKFYKIIGTFHRDKDKKFKQFFQYSEKLRRYLLIPKIFELHKNKISYKNIGKMLKISSSSIYKIIHKKNYVSFGNVINMSHK